MTVKVLTFDHVPSLAELKAAVVEVHKLDTNIAFSLMSKLPDNPEYGMEYAKCNSSYPELMRRRLQHDLDLSLWVKKVNPFLHIKGAAVIIFGYVRN